MKAGFRTETKLRLLSIFGENTGGNMKAGFRTETRFSGGIGDNTYNGGNMKAGFRTETLSPKHSERNRPTAGI